MSVSLVQSHTPSFEKEDTCECCGATEVTMRPCFFPLASVVSTAPLSTSAGVVPCTSSNEAAAMLSHADCIASLVRRPLSVETAAAFRAYLASKPAWPNFEHAHPLEPTRDRVAIIDFLGLPDSACDDVLSKGAQPPTKRPLH